VPPPKRRQIVRLSGGEVSKLDRLAVEINQHVAAAEDHFQSAVAEAIMAGEKLIEAKSLVRHGEWLPWLEQHFEFTRQTAAAYMRLAKADREQMEAAPSISAALALLTVRTGASSTTDERSTEEHLGDGWEKFLSDWEVTKPQRSDYKDGKDIKDQAIGEFLYLSASIEHNRTRELAFYRRLVAEMSARLATDLPADEMTYVVAVLGMAATGIEFQQADEAVTYASDDDHDELYETARLAWLRHRQAKDAYHALIGKPPMDEQVPMSFHDAMYVLLPELPDDADAA
jgi:Protein of unknown function (DUF3102)